MTDLVLGIEKEVDDETLAAPTSFHVASKFYLDYKGKGYYTVTIDSYFNQRAYQRGRAAIATVEYRIHETPQRGVDLITWALTSLVNAEPGSNPFTGGELILQD